MKEEESTSRRLDWGKSLSTVCLQLLFTLTNACGALSTHFPQDPYPSHLGHINSSLFCLC